VHCRDQLTGRWNYLTETRSRGANCRQVRPSAAALARQAGPVLAALRAAGPAAAHDKARRTREQKFSRSPGLSSARAELMWLGPGASPGPGGWQLRARQPGGRVGGDPVLGAPVGTGRAQAGEVTVPRRRPGRAPSLGEPVSPCLFGPACSGRLKGIETLARLSPIQPIRSLREGTRAHAIRLARCCLKPHRRPARGRHHRRADRPRLPHRSRRRHRSRPAARRPACRWAPGGQATVGRGLPCGLWGHVDVAQRPARDVGQGCRLGRRVFSPRLVLTRSTGREGHTAQWRPPHQG
jgi:hypothetical protein